MLAQGDIVKVVINNPYGSSLMVGDEGVIKIIIDNEAAVEFPFEFHDSHDCDGHVKSKNGFYIHINHLIKSSLKYQI